MNIDKKGIRVTVFFRKWPTFQIKYQDGYIKSISQHCSKEVAKSKAQQMNDRIAMGTFDIKDFFPERVISKPLLMAVKDYLAHREIEVKTGKISQSTLEKDIYSFKIFIEIVGRERIISSIDVADIHKFMMALLSENKTQYGKTYLPGSVVGYNKHISGGFTWFCRKGYSHTNPFKEVTHKLKTIKVREKNLSDEEIDKFRQYFSNKPSWQLDSFNFAIWSGCRVQSIPTVKITDIERRTVLGVNYCLLRLKEKGEKERKVPVPPSLLELIEKRIKLMKDIEAFVKTISKKISPRLFPIYRKRAEENYIFPEVIHKRSVSKAFTRARQRLNIPGISFHSLRHTYTTRNLDAGNNLVHMQQVLGHTDISTTMGYYEPSMQMILSGFLDRFPQM